MFKPLIAATIGLSAMATLASADTLIVQSGPNTPATSVIAYDGPSFDRMVEMCARFNFECGIPGHEADAFPGAHPFFSPEGQADAAKRHALMLAELEGSLSDGAMPELLAPNVGRLFGWGDLPRGGPSHFNPGPDYFRYLEGLDGQAFTTPSADDVWNNAFRSLQRPIAQHGFRANAFPHAFPYAAPRALPQILPRPAFPRFTHPRALPHGGLIPWPTL